MAKGNKVASDGSGYFNGPNELVLAGNLAREADEQDKYLASIPNGAAVSTGRVLLTVLQEAVLANASYIHIQPRQYELLIRYRIGNRLWEANAYQLGACYPLFARLKILSGVNIAERRVPQFGRFTYEQSSVLYEMRLCSIPTQRGEDFTLNVVNLLSMGSGDYTLDRHQWLDQLTQQEIMDQIHALQQERAE